MDPENCISNKFPDAAAAASLASYLENHGWAGRQLHNRPCPESWLGGMRAMAVTNCRS